MKNLAKKAARLCLVIVALGGGFAALPAQAQVMKQNGVAIPSFFFSGAEKRAREACAEERSDCRPSVKAQMDQEKQISLLFPWILLALGVLYMLMRLRKKEKLKEKARMAARAHHDPSAYRKLDRDKDEKKPDRDNDNDDGID
jgi:hypothetical protein